MWEIPSGLVKNKSKCTCSKAERRPLSNSIASCCIFPQLHREMQPVGNNYICIGPTLLRWARRHRKWNSITWLLLCWSLTGWVSNHNTCLAADNKTNFSLAKAFDFSCRWRSRRVPPPRLCVLLYGDRGVWNCSLTSATLKSKCMQYSYYKFHVHKNAGALTLARISTYAFRCTRTFTPSNQLQ